MGTFTGFVFAYFPFLVPVRKVMQNKRVVSFYHPAPSYTEHILIIPRKIAKTVFSLSADDFLAVIAMATQIRRGKTGDFSLLINGGGRQDVKQTHFHLFTGNTAAEKGLKKEDGMLLSNDETFWGETVYNLKNLLSQKNISQNNFSILIQFTGINEPYLYFLD